MTGSRINALTALAQTFVMFETHSISIRQTASLLKCYLINT